MEWGVGLLPLAVVTVAGVVEEVGGTWVEVDDVLVVVVVVVEVLEAGAVGREELGVADVLVVLYNWNIKE